MIALGGLHIHEHWMKDLGCSIIRVSYNNKIGDGITRAEKHQLVMFLTLDTQSSIVDAVRSMLDGMLGNDFHRCIDPQFNVELWITTNDDKNYVITLQPSHNIPSPMGLLRLHTTVDRNTLDIACANMEFAIKTHQRESNIIAL